jgi:Fe(3+) dicitrate transport protein
MPSKLFPALLASLALPLAAQQEAPATGKTDDQAATASNTPATGGVTTLDTIMVYGESENDSVIQNPFLMPVEGTRIFAGKRATVIDLDALPKVQANNYRQALALTPGLLVSEETTPLVSIGYRGIGTPSRTQFMQVLKDGIPIHADPFGYPEAYYTPPLDVVDRIEFIRGGGSLMYGPQPAGTLNYITYMPDRNTPFSFRTQNIGGTDGFFSNYTAITGTSGKVGYYGYYNHRQSQGFRTSNSDYRLDGGHFKLSYDIDPDSRWILALDAYEQENDEPGGLSYRDYLKNRDRATRKNDYFSLSRYVASAEYQHKIQTGTELDVKFWAGYYNRYSHRQRLSLAQGSNAFGVTPLGSQSNIEDQTFYSYGLEPRIRHDWQGLGGKHTLAAGMQFYLMDSPRRDKRGMSGPAATDGVTTGDAQRDVFYYSFFAENKFTWGNFTLTPGFRLESITQGVHSKTYTTAGVKTAERDVTKQDVQPLFGLGLAYDLPAETQVYANISQSYRPTIFTESVINTPGTTATDSDPGLGWSYELGFRGNPRQWFNFDTSLFLIDLDNRFAVSNNVLGSAGRSINYGWDGAFQIDLIGATDAARGSSLASRLGSLSYYGNVTLLNAQIHGGPNDGSTPQFAPDYMLRTGLIYGFKGIKVSFLGTFGADHKAQDSNTPQYDIPAYMTWDLTAEVPVTKNFTVMAGINNVFNEDYYSRITSNGIDPAYGRNFYLGASFQF